MGTFHPRDVERTSSTALRAGIEDDEIVLFLHAALEEGGRILVERGGNVYELYEGGDSGLHIRLIGPESGA